jgi:hypothetical protein
VGPSGIGKSSFVLQAAICWALGIPLFGIKPARPMKMLIIQAENDDGDIAEMRDGMVSGLKEAEVAGEEALQNAARSILVFRENSRTGDQFGQCLSELLEQNEDVDLVIVDPAFAYLGGDAMQARDVSRFLREILNPILVRFKVGLLIVHHTNKPPRKGDENAWRAGDYAYLGAGSSEWANWARCVIAITSIGSDQVFELKVPKRGQRLKWRSHTGETSNTRHIMHTLGTICWREPSPEELSKDRARMEKQSGHLSRPSAETAFADAKRMVLEKVWRVGDFKEHLGSALKLSGKEIVRLLKKLENDPEILRDRVNKGTSPVFLIGKKEMVEHVVRSHGLESVPAV